MFNVPIKVTDIASVSLIPTLNNVLVMSFVLNLNIFDINKDKIEWEKLEKQKLKTLQMKK